MRSVRVHTDEGKFRQKVQVGGHVLTADEPESSGGNDSGPAPHEFLLAGLGACTSMTVKVYADRKGWPVRAVDVLVEGHHDETRVFTCKRTISFEGDLTDEQRQRLLEIANKCPVHKTLSGTIRIETTLV